MIFGETFFAILVYAGLTLTTVGVLGLAVLLVRDAKEKSLW